MINKQDKNADRLIRHERVREKVSGTADRPRLNVYRSLKNIYVQIIDDVSGVTLVSASTVEKDIAGKIQGLCKTEVAKLVGNEAAKKALDAGISVVVFDRGGYVYQGRVAKVAEGAREGGLKF